MAAASALLGETHTERPSREITGCCQGSPSAKRGVPLRVQPAMLARKEMLAELALSHLPTLYQKQTNKPLSTFIFPVVILASKNCMEAGALSVTAIVLGRELGNTNCTRLCTKSSKQEKDPLSRGGTLAAALIPWSLF